MRQPRLPPYHPQPSPPPDAVSKSSTSGSQLPLKRTREKASYQFSDYLSLLEQKYNINFTKALHNINNGKPRSTYRDAATRCYLVMQQRFENDSVSFQTRFRRFQALQPAEQTLGYLFRLMEEAGQGAFVCTTSPSKLSPPTRNEAPTMSTNYRSHSGEDSATTSFTSTTSKSSVSSATTIDNADDLSSCSPARKSRYSHTKGHISSDGLLKGLSDEFDIDLDLPPRLDQPGSRTYDDSWLRRRDDPNPAVSDLGHAGGPRQAVEDPDLPSSWPYATQLESQEPSRPPRHDLVHDLGLPHLLPEVDTADAHRASFEDYRVRDLPGQGLFANHIRYIHDLAARCNASPRLAYELTRIALAGTDNAEKMMSTILPVFHNDENLWMYCEFIRDQGLAIPPPPSRSAWQAAGRGSAHVVRTGRVVFDTGRTQSFLRLVLDPLQLASTSNRFFRHFGAQRFLKLIVPSFGDIPPPLNVKRAQIHPRIQEWLNMPDKELIGCKWSAFHTRARKRKKSKSKFVEDEDEGYEVMLFATEGLDLPHITVYDLLNWFIPIKRNSRQSSCKAFARLELVFKPSQVRWTKDIQANGESESNEYRDQSPSEKSVSDHHDIVNPHVMNDGCARISIAAAQQVWTMLGEPGPCPSAFQGRIGPWKGMWMISGPPQSSEDHWIEVNDSQRKFEVHREDLDDDTFDPDRLTFEVISWSRKPSCSSFYLEFMPILEHRGVSRARLEAFVASCMDKARDDVEEAVYDRALLFKWIKDNFGSTPRTVEDTTAKQLPTEKVLTMLAAGFEPTSAYVLPTMGNLKSQHYARTSSSLNISIAQSTSVYGVADPFGCLAPNEIHLGFSTNFGDEPYPWLDNIPALVARHPALRPSDIQKVKVVFHPKLKHLVDVVVFPTRGTFPLAGKLQGGDYDGDKFWICWQKELTESFRNAPVPASDNMLPSDLGISIDRTTLGEVFDTNDDPSRFLAKNFEFAWKPNLLGMSTAFLGDMCYSSNLIDSSPHRLFVSLHDYLVDSTKSGYTFTEDDWRQFKARHADPRLKIISPAYKIASTLPLVDSIGKPVISKYKSENITDYLIFGVARARALSYILDTTQTPSDLSPGDAALPDFFLTTFRSPNFVLSTLARNLRSARDAIMRDYKVRLAHMQNGPHDQSRKFELLDEARLKASAAYAALLPSPEQRAEHVVQTWMQQAVPGTPSLWDLLKASAAAALQPEFAWTVAGKAICYLRAHAAAPGKKGPVLVVPKLFGVLKVGKVKTPGEGRRSRTRDDEGDREGVEGLDGKEEDEVKDTVGWWNGNGVAGRDEHAEHTHDLDLRDMEDGEFFDARSSPLKTA